VLLNSGREATEGADERRPAATRQLVASSISSARWTRARPRNPCALPVETGTQATIRPALSNF
jgi:hypothetical protein